jgi:hypothetical protein
MKKLFRFLLYGLLLWGSLFVYAFSLSYIKDYNPVFFNILMFIALTLFTTVFVFVLYRRKKIEFFNEGLTAGILWMFECMLLDMFLFHWGPMKMSFTRYFTEIGLSYIVIPIIVAGMGYLLDRVVKKIHYQITEKR